MEFLFVACKQAFFGWTCYQLFITEGGCTALISQRYCQGVGSAACEELCWKSHNFAVSAIGIHWMRCFSLKCIGMTESSLPTTLRKTIRQKVKHACSDMDQFFAIHNKCAAEHQEVLYNQVSPTQLPGCRILPIQRFPFFFVANKSPGRRRPVDLVPLTSQRRTWLPVAHWNCHKIPCPSFYSLMN